MHIYKVFDSANEGRADYRGSLNDAHMSAKVGEPRANMRIELHEIPTDKAAVLLYLNGQHIPDELMKPLRTWSLTERGGLKQISNGD